MIDSRRLEIAISHRATNYGASWTHLRRLLAIGDDGIVSPFLLDDFVAHQSSRCTFDAPGWRGLSSPCSEELPCR